MTTNLTKAVLEKVTKLLRLANDAGATEGERNNALRMAHGLLAKHNLEMADLEQHNSRSDRGRVCSEFPAYPWARGVCNAVATLFFSVYVASYTNNDNKGKHYFIGKEENATTAMLMAEFVVRSIKKEAERIMKERRAEGEDLRWPWFRAFGSGAALRVAERVAEIMKEREAMKASPGTSLVLASVYQLEREANEKWKKENMSTKPGRNTPLHISDGTDEGYAYGDTISLNHQVDHENQASRVLPKGR